MAQWAVDTPLGYCARGCEFESHGAAPDDGLPGKVERLNRDLGVVEVGNDPLLKV